MSQSFRWKYNEMQNGDPTKQNDETERDVSEDRYIAPSYARNICFVLADGRRLFLNYGYLVSAEYLPEDGMIILSFTSHIVTLKGIHFEKLFYDLMQGYPRQIVYQDARYNDAEETDKPIVNEINVISKIE